MKSNDTARERVPCAHDTCDLAATIRLHLPTGWANLCEPHYVMHFDTLSRRYCSERGLDQRLNETKAEWRARMMAFIRENAKLKTFADADAAEDAWSATA